MSYAHKIDYLDLIIMAIFPYKYLMQSASGHFLSSEYPTYDQNTVSPLYWAKSKGQV